MVTFSLLEADRESGVSKCHRMQKQTAGPNVKWQPESGNKATGETLYDCREAQRSKHYSGEYRLRVLARFTHLTREMK